MFYDQATEEFVLERSDFETQAAIRNAGTLEYALNSISGIFERASAEIANSKKISPRVEKIWAEAERTARQWIGTKKTTR